MFRTSTVHHTGPRRRLMALAAAALVAAAVLSLSKPAAAYTYRGGDVGGTTTGTYQQAEPTYGAPTPNLESLARNTRLAAKGVNAAVRFPSYATTSDAYVHITVTFGNAAPVTQVYSYSNGNRFSTVFPIGDGSARYEWIIIRMVEHKGGQDYVFNDARQIYIRPLWDVSISALKMKMLDHCDTVFQGRAGEVDFHFTHSGASGSLSFSLGQDETRWINEFGALWREVGVSNDLRVPTMWWYENDWDKPEVWGAPALGEERILPGPTRTLSWIEYEYGDDCRAQFSYTINVTPRYYAV